LIDEKVISDKAIETSWQILMLKLPFEVCLIEVGTKHYRSEYEIAP